MRRILWIAGVGVALLAAVVIVRALGFASRQVAAEPAPPVEVDAAAVAGRLAAGIRFRTISYQDASQLPAREFAGFRRHLERAYPRVHAALARERVAEHSLLYTWKGRNADLEPALLMAHHDVVPVEDGTEAEWAQPPFAGAVDAGYAWGRGAMDDKGSLFCILEAVESLLAQGFEPRRTLLLAFGHDEEVGGDEGAAAIAALLESRGVRLAYALDEGGTIARGVVPVLEVPVAVVGVAEKGSVGIGLSVDVTGGHSSTPPRQTAVGILSHAIAALERSPMPARIDGTTGLLFDHLGPELTFPFRLVLANLWLFGSALERAVAGQPALDAMLRTTTAATIFEGGVKENVLPSRARAVVNFRILPGDSVDDVVEHVRRSIADDRVQLQVGVRSRPRNPSAVSPVDSEDFALLQSTIRQVFPGVPVAPYLVLGGTDARHFQTLTDDVYRFGPFEYGPDDLKRAHGKDERISLENLAGGVRFYRRLIENSAG